MVKFANVAQKWILEKNQFLQQINLRAENEKTVTRCFNPNELKEPPDKKKYWKYSTSTYHLCDISAQSSISF